MSRYREITPAEMTPPQRRVHDLIVASPRGAFFGPFQILIRAPEICERVAQLGEHLRWGTSLPARLSELAIITSARFWRAQYEWYVHAPLAEEAGVPAAAIEAIRRGDTPVFTRPDEMLVYQICTDLQQRQRLSDGRFAEAIQTLGEVGLIEIVALIGYYTLIGNTLDAFMVAVPDGVTPPFPE